MIAADDTESTGDKEKDDLNKREGNYWKEKCIMQWKMTQRREKPKDKYMKNVSLEKYGVHFRRICATLFTFPCQKYEQKIDCWIYKSIIHTDTPRPRFRCAFSLEGRREVVLLMMVLFQVHNHCYCFFKIIPSLFVVLHTQLSISSLLPLLGWIAHTK